MAWWKAQCESRTNKKFAAAGAAASWVWYCANCYAREHLTDGRVDKMMLPSLVPGMSARQVQANVERLITAKLAHANEDGGFTIHDFLEHHPSKEKVKADREADSIRKRPPNDDDSSRNDTQMEGDSEVPRTRAGDSSSDSSSVSEEKKPHPISDLLAYHEQVFQHVNSGAKPAKYGGGDAKAAKNLIDRHGYETARAIVRQAFVSKAKFIAESGKSMTFIASGNVQNQLIAELVASRKSSTAMESPADHPHLQKVAGRV